MAHENSPSQKETIVFQPSIFTCELLVSGRVPSGCFQKIGIPQNGWFVMENPIKWMIWGENPLFLETPIYFQCFLSLLHPNRWNLNGMSESSSLAYLQRSWMRPPEIALFFGSSFLCFCLYKYCKSKDRKEIGFCCGKSIYAFLSHFCFEVWYCWWKKSCTTWDV